MYIGDYLGRRAIYTPNKLAIIDAGKRPELKLTYNQWNERVKRLAHWLHDTAGVSKGDRVAILARDGIEHLDVLYACGKLGAIHTAFNWRLHWRETADLIRQTTPTVLVYSDDFKADVAQIAQALAGTEAAIDHFLHIEGEGIPGSIRFQDAIDASPADPITLNVFPLFHAGGLFAYTSSQVIFGNTTVLTRQFDPAQVLELIERHKVTVFAGVPTMYQMMTQAPNYASADLSSLRFCTSGGAPLPVPLIEKYIAEKNIKFKQGFGMTEFGPGLFALAPEDAVRKAGSIGRPNFFIDVRVVDDDNRPLGPNQPGELLLKGPSRCSGYWQNPEASAAVIDDEGWFHTGDIVRYDEEWYFYVLDRKKDMFISGGENVYPAEIENALYKHPAVHMAAVVGVPDERWGEVGVACVVLKPGSQASEEELLDFLRGRLARFKVPKRVIFRESLPLSGMGKILKRELKEQLTANHDQKGT